MAGSSSEYEKVNHPLGATHQADEGALLVVDDIMFAIEPESHVPKFVVPASGTT